jgi:hypothetical protein
MRIDAWNTSQEHFWDASIFGKFYPVLGTEYDIELNWDLTTGATRLFIDGVQLGDTKTDIQTRDNVVTISLAYTNNTANYIIRDFGIFNTVQHTSNFTIKSLPVMSIIDENINTNGYIKSNSTADSTSTSTGSLIVYGGVGIAKKVYMGDGTNSSSTSTGALLVNGGVGISGTISKGGGSFSIPHPDPSKSGWTLRHCFVETNTRGDNIYRYEVTTMNNKYIIQLPDYFKYLNENPQVYVCPKCSFGTGYGIVDETMNFVTIYASIDGIYNVLVIGTRKDKLMKDFWDKDGAEISP